MRSKEDRYETFLTDKNRKDYEAKNILTMEEMLLIENLANMFINKTVKAENKVFSENRQILSEAALFPKNKNEETNIRNETLADKQKQFVSNTARKSIEDLLNDTKDFPKFIKAIVNGDTPQVMNMNRYQQGFLDELASKKDLIFVSIKEEKKNKENFQMWTQKRAAKKKETPSQGEPKQESKQLKK